MTGLYLELIALSLKCSNEWSLSPKGEPGFGRPGPLGPTGFQAVKVLSVLKVILVSLGSPVHQVVQVLMVPLDLKVDIILVRLDCKQI